VEKLFAEHGRALQKYLYRRLRPCCCQAAAGTATNSRPSPLYPLSAAPAGAAANAGPIAPLPGGAGGGGRGLSAQVASDSATSREESRYSRGYR
jgi:hypothetical protein